MDAPLSSASPKTFVLCFDGTGNKFSGTESDSNILKIYRMLDRSQGNQFHYYQPGIGTYVTTSSMDHTSVITRFKSWYDKAKDSAVGSAFADHVMGGYKFLMRYYTPEDDIYFFGFSRGAYTARFLAEMLDHVGLLSSGNEELTRFAWKTFSKWQARRGGDSREAKSKEKGMYDFMRNFRETFSRPVKRIRFLGLFDTVCSVPRFESAAAVANPVSLHIRAYAFQKMTHTHNSQFRAWMQRSKFPYTAHSSAKVIRHAVSIDERRAKFRQDLISASRNSKLAKQERNTREMEETYDQSPEETDENIPRSGDPALLQPGPPIAITARQSSFSRPMVTPSTEDFQAGSGSTPSKRRSLSRIRPRRYSDASKAQDIQEVWFAGNHSDIGGGWSRAPGEVWSLSHVPLVWMIHEAERAGLPIDAAKMSALNCCPDEIDDYGNRAPSHQKAKSFHNMFRQSGASGFIHDSLAFGGGLSATSALAWKVFEYLPFRRMDLDKNGKWHAIRWPLPQGETRDIPNDAKIHVTAIKRMQEDEEYRPGNLIVGGGGRGVRFASKKYGIGDWEVFQYRGDPVREVYIRKRSEQNGVKDEKIDST